MEQLVFCPHCGAPIKMTLSEDGLIEAVLYDMQYPDTAAGLDQALSLLGYVFGTTKGGEIDE